MDVGIQHWFCFQTNLYSIVTPHHPFITLLIGWRVNLLKYYTFIFIHPAIRCLVLFIPFITPLCLFSWICEGTSPSLYAPIRIPSWSWTWISEGSMWCLIQLVCCLILLARLLGYMFYLNVFSPLFPQSVSSGLFCLPGTSCKYLPQSLLGKFRMCTESGGWWFLYCSGFCDPFQPCRGKH